MIGREVDEMRPRVSAVVVNYNTSTLCLKAVASLKASGLHDIYVVDNASAKDELAVLHAPGDLEFHLIESNRNLGFAGGNNLALRKILDKGTVDHVLLLNSDAVIIDPDLVPSMITVMDVHPRIGLLGPIVRYTDQTTQPTALIKPKPLWIRLLTRLMWRGRRPDTMRGHAGRRIQYVDAVSAVCLLVRIETLRDAGLFDERFFMYEEEIELAIRAKKKNWHAAVVAEDGVVHLGNASSSKARLSVVWHTRLSRTYTISNHISQPAAWIEAGILSAIFAFAWLYNPWVREMGTTWFMRQFLSRVSKS